MDDGSYVNNDSRSRAQGFDIESVELLKNVIEKKYGIKSSLHKDRGGAKLYILAESKEIFMNTIQQYVLPCFSYKIKNDLIQMVDSSHPGAEEGPKG